MAPRAAGLTAHGTGRNPKRFRASGISARVKKTHQLKDLEHALAYVKHGNARNGTKRGGDMAQAGRGPRSGPAGRKEARHGPLACLGLDHAPPFGKSPLREKPHRQERLPGAAPRPARKKWREGTAQETQKEKGQGDALTFCTCAFPPTKAGRRTACSGPAPDHTGCMAESRQGPPASRTKVHSSVLWPGRSRSPERKRPVARSTTTSRLS